MSRLNERAGEITKALDLFRNLKINQQISLDEVFKKCADDPDAGYYDNHYFVYKARKMLQQEGIFIITAGSKSGKLVRVNLNEKIKEAKNKFKIQIEYLEKFQGELSIFEGTPLAGEAKVIHRCIDNILTCYDKRNDVVLKCDDLIANPLNQANQADAIKITMPDKPAKVDLPFTQEQINFINDLCATAALQALESYVYVLNKVKVSNNKVR